MTWTECREGDDPRPFTKLKPAEKLERYWDQLIVQDAEHGPDWIPRKEYELDRNAAGEIGPGNRKKPWRVDYCWTVGHIVPVGVEVDGFGYGHQAQQRIMDNNLKRNYMAESGWLTLVYDSRLLGSKQKVEDAVWQIRDAICLHSERAGLSDRRG